MEPTGRPDRLQQQVLDDIRLQQQALDDFRQVCAQEEQNWFWKKLSRNRRRKGRFASWANRLVTAASGEQQTGRAAAWMLVLGAATAVSTLLAGVAHAAAFSIAAHGTMAPWPVLPRAAVFAATLLAILGAHEWGHWRMAGAWKTRRSLPMLLPAPTLTGTFGAFMAVRSRPPHRRALFDIAIGGPLAGLVIAIPALIAGIALSEPVAVERLTATRGPVWGEGIATAAIRSALIGPIGSGEVLAMHPLGVAGAIGMLLTAVNLLPLQPLDGGHMARALAPNALTAATIGGAAVGGVWLAASHWPDWNLARWLVLAVWAFGSRSYIEPEEQAEGTGWKRAATAVILWGTMAMFLPANPISWPGN